MLPPRPPTGGHGPLDRRAPRRRSGLAGLGGLALLLLAGRAEAGGETIGLEARGAYHGYDFDSEWTQYREQLLEESLRAEYSAWLVEQAIASYTLGLTLGVADLYTDSDHRRYLRADYDAFTEFWREGTVPVTLYARRNTLDMGADTVPAQRTVAQTAGYSAALVPETGPRLRSRGYLQDMMVDGADGERFQRRWEMAGDVSHYSSRLNGRASLKRDALVGDLSSQDRVIDTARIDADYRVLETLSVATQALSRSYRLGGSGDDYRVESDSANSHLRWTPSERLLGTVSTQLSRREYAGNGTSTERIGVTFGVPDGGAWSAVGGAGVESSAYEDDGGDGPHAFIGEYADALVIHQQSGAHGSVRIEGTGAVAYFEETGVGAGLQQGFTGRVLGSRIIAGPMFRLLAGARLGRQWDASPRDLDYSLYGWEAAMESRPTRDLTLYVQADQVVYAQLSDEEGDSDRFELHGFLRYAIGRDFSFEYGLSQGRVVLDDSYSGTLGQSLRGTVTLGRGLLWSVGGYRYLYDDDVSAPWWWTRGETELRLERGLTSIRGRVGVDLSSGDTTQTTAAAAYVELRRRWRWAL